MRHVKIAELALSGVVPSGLGASGSVDDISRELALTAASGDQRMRLLSAMQMLGSIRDILVAPQSSGAGRIVDQAIKELMRRERELPAEWR